MNLFKKLFTKKTSSCCNIEIKEEKCCEVEDKEEEKEEKCCECC